LNMTIEKQVKILGIAKWLALPLGYIMYFGTEYSFGGGVAMVLAIFAMMTFWILVKSEQARRIGETIADEIKAAISEFGNIESVVEIKKMRSGIIARIYLVNAREKAVYVHRAITRKLDQCSMKKYLWVMQLTDMPGKGAFKETRERLDEQLIEELLNKRKGEHE